MCFSMKIAALCFAPFLTSLLTLPAIMNPIAESVCKAGEVLVKFSKAHTQTLAIMGFLRYTVTKYRGFSGR